MGLLLALCGGCQAALVGDWHMVRALPGREVFALDQLRFERDGRFVATITLEGKTRREEGHYRFDGRRLHLQPTGGGLHTYAATLKLDTLELHDRDRHVILARGGP